jgi:hypothetical protein
MKRHPLIIWVALIAIVSAAAWDISWKIYDAYTPRFLITLSSSQKEVKSGKSFELNVVIQKNSYWPYIYGSCPCGPYKGDGFVPIIWRDNEAELQWKRSCGAVFSCVSGAGKIYSKRYRNEYPITIEPKDFDIENPGIYNVQVTGEESKSNIVRIKVIP